MHCNAYLQTAYGYTSLQCKLLLKVYIIYIRAWLPRETYCNAPLLPTTANKLAQLWLRYFVFNMQRGGTLQTVRNAEPKFPLGAMHVYK
jgi:hypothetical protein